MVCFQKVIILLMTILCLVVSEENTESDNLFVELTETQSRDLKEEWREAENGNPYFIPKWNEEMSTSEENTSTRVKKRRRRIRKRKRRPQQKPTQELDFDSLMTFEPLRRKVRPERLDEVDDSWINISEEIMGQPHNRRRTNPTFESDNDDEISSNSDGLSFERFGPDDALKTKSTTPSPKFYEKVRDPFTALEEDDKIKKRRKGASDIKNILKKTGSVSEVLQKKNLSLTDLLMGKEQAISALTDPSIIDSQVPIKEYRNPVREHVPFFKNNENYAELTKKKAENFDNVHEINKVHRFGQTSTTEVYTEQKHETPEATTITPSTTSTLKTTANSNYYPKKKFKGTTADENNNNQHQVQKTTIINKDPSHEEGPIRMSLNVNHLTKKEGKKEETHTELPEKLRPFSAKEEIMEMMNDPEGSRRLSRILELKNITLDELIEMRERGSSKKHLADLFHNQNKEPEPPKEPFIGHIRTSVKRGPLIHPDRKPKVLEEETEITVSEKQEAAVNSSTESYTTTTFPMIRITKNISNPYEVDSNKMLWTNILSNKADAIGDDEHDRLLISKKIEDILENDVRRIDDLGSNLSDAFNDQLQMDFDETFTQKRVDSNTVQNGIASAILASLSIVGVSLLVFLTILIVFKLSRRKKNRRSLLNHFSEYKSKYPILGESLRKPFTLSVPEADSPKKVRDRDPTSFIKQVPENENRKPYEPVACY